MRGTAGNGATANVPHIDMRKEPRRITPKRSVSPEAERQIKEARAKRREARDVHSNQASAGLGDRIETVLSSIGITPESYVNFKTKFGLPPTCGCADRKAWLNNFGATFGVTTEKLRDLLKRPWREPTQSPPVESSPTEPPAESQPPDASAPQTPAL